MKKIIHQIHLWLGLGASIILFLICFSGTALIYQAELQEFFKPEIYKVTPGEKALSLETLISQLEEKSGGNVSGIYIQAEPSRSYQFYVKTNPNDRRGDSYIVDQYSGKILNNPKDKNSIFMFFFKLHRWLLLDPEIGRPIVGISTIIFGTLLISGFYLWWPKSKKHLKSSLKIKMSTIRRFNHDLHNSLGFYASIFLMIMTLTGLCWSFEWYRDLGSKVLGTQIFNRGGGRPAELVDMGEERLDYASILDAANEALPYSGSFFIPVSKEKNIPVSISKTNSEWFSINATEKVDIDPYTGAVLKIDKFSDKKFGEKISALIKSLHLGDFYGPISKLIYFIACLIGTSLPITGFFIWFNKRRRHA